MNRPRGRGLSGPQLGAPGRQVFDSLLRNFHSSPTLLAFSLNS